jgi:hypothetical protein
MRNIDDIDEKVEKRKRQLEPLFKKDKENYDLWAGVEQKFGDHNMDVNITGTEMTSLARRTQASIIRSRPDIHVWTFKSLENRDAVDTANKEEQMYYYAFRMADERLITLGETTLIPATSWQAAVLGRTAVRVLVYLDKDTGEIVWDFLPMNPAFLTFSFDSKGLAWYRYETYRNPDSIKSEYGIKEVTEDAEGKGVSVSDYWDRDHNVRYLTKGKERLGKAWKHNLGEVPAIILPVAGGPKAIDTEGIQVTQWGQSIFDPIKTSFESLNKMRSIWATHAHMMAKSPTEEIYEEGTDPNIEEEHIEFHAGALIKHPKSIELKPMEIKDIPNSLPAMIGDLQTGIERASYAALNPDKPAHSGTALRILGQDKMDFESPVLATMNTLSTRICRMVKKQIVKGGLKVPVRTVVNGEYQDYEMTPDMLDNDFYVQSEFINQDVYAEVEALQEAQLFQQNRWMSREDIMEKKLRIQDVPTQMAKMDMDTIESTIPELKIKELIIAYQKKGDPLSLDKAKNLKEKLFLLEAEQRQAVVPQEGAPAGGAPMGGAPAGAPPPPRPGVPT